MVHKPPYNYPALYDAYPPEDPAVLAFIPVASTAHKSNFVFAKKALVVTTVAIVCPAVRKEVAPKTFTYKSLPTVAVSSTGTNLLPAITVVHLPSARGWAFQVNTKSALVAALLVDKTLPEAVETGALDSPLFYTKVSYLPASPLSILRSSVETVYHESPCAFTSTVHVILTKVVATKPAAAVHDFVVPKLRS